MRNGIVVARSVVLACAALSPGIATSAAPIYGGPTYDSVAGTGYNNPTIRRTPSGAAGNGVGVGAASRYSGGAFLGLRAIRWDASGPATELGGISTSAAGVMESSAVAVNPAGVAVGYAIKYSGNTNLGGRAVRWNASGSATELGHLGASASGLTYSSASAVNAAGTAVGIAWKFSNGVNVGTSAVRWDASGTAAVELGGISTGASGATYSEPYAINAAGTVVGYAIKYSGTASLGERAVRWDASGAATELGNLGTNASGVTSSRAWAVNAAGTAVGRASRFLNGVNSGSSAVRWDFPGTVATELGNLGEDASGFAESQAWAVNAAGTAVGYAGKYSGIAHLGNRAVRWNASDTAATELGNLGTDASGWTTNYAYDVNAAGIAVGVARKYSGGQYVGDRAVYWGVDSAAIDLNSLLSSADASLWTLISAYGISDTNWVTGLGFFDPDGAGPLAGYIRAFLIQVPALPGACCSGATCSVLAQSLCTGPLTRYIGPGSVCNAAGNTVQPCCVADFNQNADRDVDDIFLFLNAWFAGDVRTDVSRDGVRDIDDIFTFLPAWFGGC